jgi:hypothetical protein
MVYFIVDERHDEVKIGYTSNIKIRLSTLRTARPSIKCFAMMDGDKETEKMWHDTFSSRRLEGEWFRWSGMIKDFMMDTRNFICIE